MLANALPKLNSLKNVHCAMRWKDMLSFLRVLESANHKLSGLSLMFVNTCFSFCALNPI